MSRITSHGSIRLFGLYPSTDAETILAVREDIELPHRSSLRAVAMSGIYRIISKDSSSAIFVGIGWLYIPRQAFHHLKNLSPGSLFVLHCETSLKVTLGASPRHSPNGLLRTLKAVVDRAQSAVYDMHVPSTAVTSLQPRTYARFWWLQGPRQAVPQLWQSVQTDIKARLYHHDGNAPQVARPKLVFPGSRTQSEGYIMSELDTSLVQSIVIEPLIGVLLRPIHSSPGRSADPVCLTITLAES
ncbi:hypothetical protein BDR04DRAFT_1121600 [Suillus decipiens]|nr:hypothetical protein BDR04DRAFT_1121600 [Suillus decipiens]